MANTRNEGTSNRGFASMDPDEQREIASRGGVQPMPAAMRMNLHPKKRVKPAAQPMPVAMHMSLRQKKHAVPAPEVI